MDCCVLKQMEICFHLLHIVENTILTLTFLETKVNGCHKRWYGKTKDHKTLLSKGIDLPPWKDITIRCHDFRVDFCTRAYEAGIPLKTLQSWMGHADSTMVLNVYTKLTAEHEKDEAVKLTGFMSRELCEKAAISHGKQHEISSGFDHRLTT